VDKGSNELLNGGAGGNDELWSLVMMGRLESEKSEKTGELIWCCFGKGRLEERLAWNIRGDSWSQIRKTLTRSQGRNPKVKGFGSFGTLPLRIFQGFYESY
jgi:hypothetical protein